VPTVHVLSHVIFPCISHRTFPHIRTNVARKQSGLRCATGHGSMCKCVASCIAHFNIIVPYTLHIPKKRLPCGFQYQNFQAFLACPIGATIPAHTRPLLHVHPCAQTLSSTLPSVISHRFCFPQFEFHHGWISIFFLATIPWAYYVLLKFNFLSSSYENRSRQFYRVFMQF
jgi:hypothetical protein